MTTPSYTKSIQYIPETRDFAMQLDGQIVGYAPSWVAAEEQLDGLVYNLLERDAATVAAYEAEAAAPISAPVAVAVYQVSATAMYEVVVAGHRYHLHDAYELGISWMGGDGPRISSASYDGLKALWRALFAPALAPAYEADGATPAAVAAACAGMAEEYRDTANGLAEQGNADAAKDLRSAARAAEKASFCALEGTQIARWVGDVLMVKSGSTGAVYYAVRRNGCCCKAADKHASCWHSMLRCGAERAMEAMEAGYALAA